MAKVVYQDGDYTKVIRGNYTEDAVFININNMRINKRFVISIKEGE